MNGNDTQESNCRIKQDQVGLYSFVTCRQRIIVLIIDGVLTIQSLQYSVVQYFKDYIIQIVRNVYGGVMRVSEPRTFVLHTKNPYFAWKTEKWNFLCGSLKIRFSNKNLKFFPFSPAWYDISGSNFFISTLVKMGCVLFFSWKCVFYEISQLLQN